MVLASLKARVFFVVLFAGTLSCGAAASAEQPDTQALLNRVVAHYTHANAIHLEATVVAVTHSELEQTTHTSYLSAWVTTGGRFRYEGRYFGGSGLIVSDGTSEWQLARSWGQYTKKPAGTYFHGRIVYEYDKWAILDARELIGRITGLDAQVREPKTLAPQRLRYQGRNVRCVVVQYRTMDSQQPVEHTLWIDPASLTVLRQESRSPNSYYFKGKPLPHGPVSENVVTTTYTTTEIDRPFAADTFTFTPPAGTTEVAELPSSLDLSKQQPQPDRHAEYIGKPLPTVTLNDTAGTKIPLSSFTGHPLLISVWATWCGPCVQELPALDGIRSAMASTDLQMIAIDQDESPTTATALLNRRGYAWKDFHADLSTAQQLGVDGLPTIILADASGRVVYYGLGGDMQSLKTAIRGLGHAYESALPN